MRARRYNDCLSVLCFVALMHLHTRGEQHMAVWAGQEAWDRLQVPVSFVILTQAAPVVTKTTVVAPC